MDFCVLIPARYRSTRLPGKVLLDICGKPMIEHVWEKAIQSGAKNVFIATDDIRVFSVAESFGAEVIMTASSHVCGTDRIVEAAKILNLDKNRIVVNVQGDEPLMPSSVIKQVAEAMNENFDIDMATLYEIMEKENEVIDPNKVKVVFNKDGRALYFSRAPIPWGIIGPWHRHIGIYGYRVSFLRKFSTWSPSPLELTEGLEQLRALEFGAFVHVERAKETILAGVDTFSDIELTRSYLKKLSNDKVV